MKTWMGAAAGVVAGLVLWSGAALGQSKPSPCDPSRTPEKLEGEVVKVDVAHGKVTVRGPDGATHELQASAETLKELKPGDRLEAKLRAKPNC